MINKIVRDMAEAMQGIQDGSTVLIGGFGAVGQPNALIDGLIEQGAKDLTVVANNAGVGRIGLARLMELGRVRKIICSFPRSSDPVVFETLYREGRIELEIVPQGTLAERMHAAGAGIPLFFTATGVGTKMAMGKEVREIDGRSYVAERALPGDVALVEFLGSRPMGQSDVPRVRPELQPRDGDGRQTDYRAVAAHPRAGRDQSGSRAYAGNFREPRAACAVRRSERILISDYAASVLASDPISDLTFSASACVAGLYTTIPKSGRPSSAKAEYSNAMGPAIGCRNCFSPSP